MKFEQQPGPIDWQRQYLSAKDKKIDVHGNWCHLVLLSLAVLVPPTTMAGDIITSAIRSFFQLIAGHDCPAAYNLAGDMSMGFDF